MATVIGDVEVDFSGLVDANPWVDSDFSGASGFRVVSGLLKRNTQTGVFSIFRYTASVPAGVITAKGEMVRSSGDISDLDGPCIVDSSGNGYYWRAAGGNMRLIKLAAGADAGTIIFGPTETFASNSEFSLTLDPSDGSLEVFLNGVSKGTVTDTDYNTGMSAGGVKEYTASQDNFGFTSWAADGYAAASSVTPSASSYTYNERITFTTTLTSLTSATLTDTNGNVFTLTGVTDTGADIPAIAAALDACLTGAVTLTVSDGTDSATAAITLDPLDGYTLTTLTSLAGTPSWVDDFTTAAEVGDQGQTNEPRLTLNADGSYTATGTTAFSTDVWVTSKTGGEITKVTYNFEGSGGGGENKLTFTKLTGVKLTATKLEASKL